MKISKLFHSLYAVLMFLPVMVIPIFAININQKSVEPIQVEVQEKISVDFNQKFNTNDINVTFDNNIVNTQITDGLINFNVYSTSNAVNVDLINWSQDYFVFFTPNHKYYPKLVMLVDTITGGAVNNGNFFLYPSYLAFNQIGTTNSAQSGLHFYKSSNLENGINLQFYFNLFDLTQMFGAGNEPTKEEFDTYFDANFYPQIQSQKMLINKPTTTIYNDTDVGSQFLYSLYIPVHDYFNIVNWMNLGGLYDWFLLNIFNGVNALVIEIIFNLIVYWLMVSFVWLIFDVLMYVPSMIHKMLDKARME